MKSHRSIAQLQRQLQQWWFSAGMMIMLSGCALQAPEAIVEGPSNNPEFAAVIAQPNDYQGDQVRWGGTITAVENRGENDTVLIIASNALNSKGKPLADAGSQGQFMAKINHFLNPAVYTDRSVTVVGTIVGSESRVIGNDPDAYPFVAVDDYYLWPDSCRRGEFIVASPHPDTASPYPDTRFRYGRTFNRCP